MIELYVSEICHKFQTLAVHDCFEHAAGQDIFLLAWYQVLSYDVLLLNIRLIVNSVIALLQFNYNLKKCQIFIDSPNLKQS
jgi:hypothetical protein